MYIIEPAPVEDVVEEPAPVVEPVPEPAAPEPAAPAATPPVNNPQAALERSRARREARQSRTSASASASARAVEATQPQPVTPGIPYQATHPTPEPAAPAVVPPAAMSQAEQDALAKARARRPVSTMATSGPAVQPGSVSMPTANAAPIPAAMSQAEQDALAKARARRGPAVQAGSVSVPTANAQSIPPAAMTQAEQDAMAKASARVGRPTRRQQAQQAQAEADAAAKAAARNGPPVVQGVANVGPPVVEASADPGTPGGLDELERRREQRAAAREARRGNRQSVNAPEAAAAAATATASAAAPRSSAVFSGMNEDERQRRFDAKMAQMDQAHADTREQRETSGTSAPPSKANANISKIVATPTPVAPPTAPVTTTSTGTNFSSMNDDERQRRYDAKMAQLDQAHGDSREKRGAPTATNSLAAPQPQISTTSSKLDSFTAASTRLPTPSPIVPTTLTSSTMPRGVTTTADRGVAVAPDVEYGEYQSPQIPDGELAVAVAIEEEEEEEKDIVYAIEYDPDSKPPIYQNRRFRYYGIGGAVVFVILAIVLVVGIVVGNGKENRIYVTDAPTGSPTSPPTSTEESMFVSRISQAFVGLNSQLQDDGQEPPSTPDDVSPVGDLLSEIRDKLLDPTTPHYKAAQWIMYEDPLQMDVQNPLLIQRYMMAFLYFHTSRNGEQPWRACEPKRHTCITPAPGIESLDSEEYYAQCPEWECNPPKEGEDDTCTSLEFTRLDNDCIDYEPKANKVRWLSGQAVCKWEGVLCAGGAEVLGVNLCK